VEQKEKRWILLGSLKAASKLVVEREFLKKKNLWARKKRSLKKRGKKIGWAKPSGQESFGTEIDK